MNDYSDIIALIRKLLDKSINEDELLLLQKWCEESPFNADLLNKIENEKMLLDDVRVWLELRDSNKSWLDQLESRTFSKIFNTNKNRRKINLNFLSVAATLCVVISISLLIYHYTGMSPQSYTIDDLDPGTNKARITLSDGKVIDLSADQEGVVFGAEALQYKDGTLIENIDTDNLVYAILETPKGGQYHITLSDGTAVWLNAGSKFKYPIVFKGNKREVELEGEAFFDVKSTSIKGSKIPFIVKTSHQEIEVLGTKFNVNAYANTSNVKQLTTLVEGKVLIAAATDQMTLEPGDQGVVTNTHLEKKKVDVNSYIAWVDNKFIFEDADLREVLSVLGRWYDFEFVVDHPKYNVQLYANISRSKNLKEVLDILKQSGIKFRIAKIDGVNKLIITN